MRRGSGSGWEGVGCDWDWIWSWVGSNWLVGVELVREWCWVGWRQGRYGGYGGWEFGLGGENGV